MGWTLHQQWRPFPCSDMVMPTVAIHHRCQWATWRFSICVAALCSTPQCTANPDHGLFFMFLPLQNVNNVSAFLTEQGGAHPPRAALKTLKSAPHSERLFSWSHFSGLQLARTSSSLACMGIKSSAVIRIVKCQGQRSLDESVTPAQIFPMGCQGQEMHSSIELLGGVGYQRTPTT